MAQSLLDELEEIVSQLEVIPETKKYWLIRTHGGEYYQTFRDNGFVAIDHEEITLHDLYEAKRKYPVDDHLLHKEVKDIAARKYDLDGSGLIAGQVFRFMYELKKGDVVIIPSQGSDTVSFGVVTQSHVPETDDEELVRTNCNFKKRKLVDWKIDVPKRKLDPYMFKMFQAHQAINNVSAYRDVIERTMGTFFVQEEDASLVLMVQEDENINALNLFSLGYNLLESVDSFIKDHGLPLDVSNVDVKINVNSAGRIQLTSKDKKVIWLVAVIGIVLGGGGLKIESVGLDLSTNGIIQKVIDYQNNSQDREMREKVMNSMDSLKVLPPQDALNLVKQFSTNKDNPK